MNRLKNIILMAALGCSLGATALPVDAGRATLVANNFWSAKQPSKSLPALENRTADWAYDGIYLFTSPQGGFVLVSADDAARPILGYSTTETMDPDNLPQALQEWLQGYQDQIDYLRTNGGAAYARDAVEWQRLEKGLCGSKDGDGMEPLLTTLWDQETPYNDLCPSGTVTGCAATAQAQMMKFWNYPAFGNGQHTYTSGRYGEQSADFAHTLYDWANMPNKPTSASPANERLAVATLMYHCGVSLNMAYNTAAGGGSAAGGLAGMSGIPSIDNSLKDYFFYSPNMQVIHKDYGYTNETWRNALKNELDKGHPIVYTGSGTYGGHGFVCDGYDGDLNMHFNFGWSGIGNGYYPVDSISPGVGGAGGNVTYSFNMSNAALLGAVPDYALRVSDTMFSFMGEGGMDSVLMCTNDTLQAAWTVSCDAPWVRVSHDDFSHAGWVRFEVDNLADGSERLAMLTFTQGNLTRQVRIVQVAYTAEEMCPLTVVMENSRSGGWANGAHLTLESSNGFVFGTARLESGSRDEVTIAVAPHDVYSVWHSGGGTDRYINYYVKNQYGENYVEAEYAYRTGGTHLISWPCAHVDVDPVADPQAILLYPNPTAGKVVIDCHGLQRAEIYDLGGRMVAVSHSNEADLGQLPDGVYFIKLVCDDGVSVRKVVKRQ